MVLSLESCKYRENIKIFTKAYNQLNTKSSEAWFGLNNPLRLGLVSYCTRIATLYKDAYESNKNLNKVKFVHEINAEIDGIEKLLMNELNVQLCRVGVIDGTDAYCVSMDIDKNLVGKSDKAKQLRIDMNDIIETNNGFKFKNKEGKYLIFGFGLRFFEPKLDFTPEEVAGVMMHEIGHCFQHMLIGVNTNIVYDIIADNMVAAYEKLKLTNIIKRIFTFNPVFIILTLFDPFISFFHMGKAASLNNQLEKNNGENIGDKLYDKMDESTMLDRDKDGELNKANNDNTIKNTLNKSSNNILMKTLGGFIRIFRTLLSPIAIILNAPANLYLTTNTKFLKKNRQFEEFADMFTMYYGLGDDFNHALAKIGNDCHKNDMGALNFLNYVPLVNLALNYNYYSQLNTQLLVKGYPEMKVRIANVYKGLEYELKNNKDLTNQDKLIIQNQMIRSETIYNEYVFGKGSKNFVYKMYNSLIKSAIQKDANDSTVTENIIYVMENNKKQASTEETAIA